MIQPTQPPQFQPGMRLAQYELTRQVGMGGMGVVYLARDVDLQRDVAVKVLRTEFTENSEDRSHDRFLREAQSAARLNHPNVATVYQIGRENGVTFIVMEWMEGGSLSEHLRKNVFIDWREATTAIRDAAAGLAAAHAAGVIHRDIKPSNLMRTNAGRVKIVDFGLARLHDMQSDLTQSGAVLGTPAYLSPEQCRGEAGTALSDIYALICTYFHLLTSRPPFTAPNPLGLLHQHMNEPFPDARKFAEEIPDAVCAVLQRDGQKIPADRHASAAALLEDLDALLAGRGETTVVSAVAPIATPNNLVLPPTSFIGRRKEIDEIRRQLSQSRLVTLLGPGGIGKTRLSVHVARQILNEYPGGVWLVELASLNTPDRIPQAIADVLGLRETRGELLAEIILPHLRPLRALLLLDNCEHLAADVAVIASQLLTACPDLRILATSRQPLASAEETLLRISSLDAPPSGALPPVSELSQIDAVRLFLDRAARARSSFTLTADNAADVANICKRLDGIPLAIELAAARINVLSPRQIIERLDDAFKLLTTGPRSALPRQQTLRALIDWSYQLLSDAQRTAFARLGVFVGGCSLESAEAVIGADGIEQSAVLDLVTELVDKSLLVVEESFGVTRFRMLDTIRHFAIEKLDEPTRRRHLDHFMELAEQAVREFTGPQQADYLRRMDAEQDNLLAAMNFAGTSEAGLRFAAAVARYWMMRGKVFEGLARLEKLIAAAPAGDSNYMARVLDGAGRMATHCGATTKSRDLLDRALTMAMAVGDRTATASATNNLGTLDMETGDLASATERHTAALAMYRALGDKPKIAGLLNNLGLTAKHKGDAANSRRFLQEALAIHKELGNATWIAYIYQNLAEVELDQGNTRTARSWYESSLKMLKELGDAWGASYAVEGLGKCSMQENDLPAAKLRFEEVLVTVRKVGDKAAVADQLDHLAQVAIRGGDPGSAAPLAEESLILRQELNDRLSLAQSLETLAAAAVVSDANRAAQLLGAADTLRQTAKFPLPPSMRERHESLRSTLIVALGDEGFREAFVSGQSLDSSNPAILIPAHMK